MLQPAAARPPRQDNRRQQLLDAAAELFSERGFHTASMREMARAAGMLPGSIYYHFASKEELLLAVYAEGVRRIAARVDAAVAVEADPWARLRAACVAHLETLLSGSGYAKVVIRVLPQDGGAVAPQLVGLRDGYEQRFVDLVDVLDLPADVDRRALRLLLIGGLNWAQTWYRPDGQPPRVIAESFLAMLRGPLADDAAVPQSRRAS